MLEPPIFKKHRQDVVPGLPCPLVIDGETYFGRGVQRKLQTSAHFIREAERTGYLTHQGGTKPTEGQRIPYETNSIVELISTLWGNPLEEILLKRNGILPAQVMTCSPQQRLTILSNAYEGVGWYDQFTNKQEAIAREAKEKSKKLPKVREWHLITRENLREWFICNRETAEKIIDLGFIRPAKKQPINVWPPQNYIDNYSLAVLLTHFYKVPLKELFVPKEKDEFYQGLIKEYLPTRIEKELKRHGLNPLGGYTITEATRILHRHEGRIRDHVTRRTLRSTKIQGKQYIQGLDLALWNMKRTDTPYLSSLEVADIFGIPIHQFHQLGISGTLSGKLGTLRTVVPLFDKVSQEAKKRVLSRLEKTEQVLNHNLK